MAAQVFLLRGREFEYLLRSAQTFEHLIIVSPAAFKAATSSNVTKPSLLISAVVAFLACSAVAGVI